MTKPSKALVWSLGHSLSFADLSSKGKINWPVLLSECDEQGRFLSDPKSYKRAICPIVDEIQMDDVMTLLAELQEHGMAMVYQKHNLDLGQIINWWFYQKGVLWREPSKWPPPDGWLDRIRYKKGSKIITVNWDTPGGFIDGPPNNIIQHNIIQHNDGINMPSAYHDHSMLILYSTIFEDVTGTSVAGADQAEEMNAWMQDVSEDWFRAACKEAADNNARKWSYVRAILERWKAEGRQSKRGKGKRDSKGTYHAEHDEAAKERERSRRRKSGAKAG